MLDLLFNLLDFNQAVNDINGGNFTTDAVNYHAYPNTFLFSLIDEQGDLTCCVLGFHEYIFDPTTNPESRWIYAFASWIARGMPGYPRDRRSCGRASRRHSPDRHQGKE